MPVFTVAQVARHLKGSLDQDPLLRDLWVSGEVSNLTVSQAGHSYFTVKDSEAQLRCVMFQSRKGAELLASGSAVIAHGYISFYEARGLVEYRVDVVVPEGTGPLHLELEKLKMTLESEGLFEPSRKRPLPHFPRVIGVATSPAGAVLHDILNIFRRRYPLVQVVVAPTPVQGEEAAPRISDAINALNQDSDADLIILARGGGSLEELWPFNEEQVARAIYSSRLPVVSAVGHETDYTIADYVADVRAPTPSAAAELVVPDREELLATTAELRKRLAYAVAGHLEERRNSLRAMMHRLWSRRPDVEALHRRLDDIAQSAIFAFTAGLHLRREQVRGLEQRLQASNPQGILARGYAVVQKQPSGETVSRVGQVGGGDMLKVTVSDGQFPAVAGEKLPTRRIKKKPVYAGERLL